MKTRIFLAVLACLLFVIAVRAEVKLRHQGTACQLLVQGKPMLVLGGELSNSAASSIADIDSVLPGMRKLGLNTVFVPVYWDLLESQEGQFDFSLVDEDISVARANDLKIVFLWFGAWKNSMSCYAPMWFKQNVKKYPRAETASGKPLEIASAFSDEVLQADKKAFCQLMTHIRQTDSKENTVVMIQVENEIGMLESARDHSALAEKMWKAGVPPITGTDSPRPGPWSWKQASFGRRQAARRTGWKAISQPACGSVPIFLEARLVDPLWRAFAARALQIAA
jgi:beta-galactosidase GanA